MTRPILRLPLVAAALTVLVSAPAPLHPAPKPRPAGAPPGAAPTPPPRLAAASLGPLLRRLGYEPLPQGRFQRIRFEEQGYGYPVDVALTPRGEWLVCVAQLAPIPDLTKLPAPALLNLLAANDTMTGMAFSYDRAAAAIMLNATIPNRSVDGAILRSMLEAIRATVRRSEALWDPQKW